MSASGANEDRAAVGKRIGEARRELGLTQAELAARIGVPLGMLDRYETGKADSAGSLIRIAEVTDRPVSWFTPSSRYAVWDEGHEAESPAQVGQRIAESRARHGLTQRELAEAVGVSLGKIERYESGAESPADVLQQVATVLGEPISWLETGDQSARSYDQRDLTGLMNDVAAAGAGAALDAPTQVEAEATPSPPERLDTLRDSDFGRDVAIQELEATSSPPAEPEAASAPPALPAPPLQIELADLPRKTLGYHPNATAELFEQVADFYTRLWEERAGLAQRLDAVQAELADEQRKHGAAAAEIAQLEQELERVNRNQLALADLVAKLEAELRRAEGRAAEATDRLEQADEELQRFREQERSLAEALVWARHTASTLSDKAEQEAAKIVQAAEQRAADLVSERQREVERLTSERQRFETLTKEVQEDLSEFLLGTLDRLKERVEPTAVSDDSA